MPPKKEPQYDLATLPEWKYFSVVLRYEGKKERSQSLHAKLLSQASVKFTLLSKE